MLTRTHKILIGAFGVQVVLALVMWLRGNAATALKEHPILAGLDAAKVTRVQVYGENRPPVDLVKKDKNWVIASSFSYPADAAKITKLATSIAKMAAAEPIATQAARHKQLRVADDEFERKLVITADGKDTTLFVGTPAGMGRSAVRIAGSDDVYAVSGVSAFAAGTAPREWATPAYVDVPRDDIAKVTVQRGGESFEVVRTPAPPAGSGAPPAGDTTTATIDGKPIALEAGETFDTFAADSVISEASNIEMTAPADPKREVSNPVVTITIDRKAAGTASPAPVVVDVFANDDKTYYVRQRGLDRAVTVDKSRLDGAVKVDRSKLVKPPPPPPPKDAGSGAPKGAAPGIPGAPPPTPKAPTPPAPKAATTPPPKAPTPPAAKPATPPAPKPTAPKGGGSNASP
jgi:hypothetical protein